MRGSSLYIGGTHSNVCQASLPFISIIMFRGIHDYLNKKSVFITRRLIAVTEETKGDTGGVSKVRLG